MDHVKLPSHQHPLYRTAEFRRCDACLRGGYSDVSGYRCSECRHLFYHKECAESPPEINHPSHPQHPLRLLVDPKSCNNRCRLCGKISYMVVYHCSVCDFSLDTGCARNPPPLVIEHPKAHEHSLTLVPRESDFDFTCSVCDDLSVGYPYVCTRCDLFFHVDCAELSREINHPSHPNHPLKLLTDGEPDYTDGKCCLCGKEFRRQRLYHCSMCKFSLDLDCAMNPPPLVLMNPKSHEHKLTLMSRPIFFTCNACGMYGDRSPYVCLQCNFTIHRDCIFLPRVININRHDHRVFHTNLLGPGKWECGVCHHKIDWAYGAYSCSLCPDYAIHSKCATRYDVWDGKELEGKPEEIEDIESFKVIDDNIIKHFSHEEHNLRLQTDDFTCGENKHCEACFRPIYPIPFYSCMQCDFVLHERCAKCPRKKRHVILTEPFTLITGARYSLDSFACCICQQLSNGFRYNSRGIPLDIQCGSFSEPFDHESHPHPLYKCNENRHANCVACGKQAWNPLICINSGCNFAIDFKCAVLPTTVKHKSDRHSLRLCYGENASGRYWCDICEEELNPITWFYTCDDCGTTMHMDCVVEDFASLAPGSIITHGEFRVGGSTRWEYRFEVVPNNHISRPFCCLCQRRCKYSVILKTHDDTNRYICSRGCLRIFLPM